MEMILGFDLCILILNAIDVVLQVWGENINLELKHFFLGYLFHLEAKNRKLESKVWTCGLYPR